MDYRIEITKTIAAYNLLTGISINILKITIKSEETGQKRNNALKFSNETSPTIFTCHESSIESLVILHRGIKMKDSITVDDRCTWHLQPKFTNLASRFYITGMSHG